MDTHDYGSEEPIEALAGELDALVRAFEAHADTQVRRDVFTLLQRVDTLHRGALTRLIVALRGAGADGALAQALEDPAVRMLLELYDLLPGDDPGPVEIVLDQVRPYLAAHGVAVRLAGVAGGVVRLRLVRTTDTHSGTHVPAQEVVDTALREQFPALQRIELEEDAPAAPANFIPLAMLGVSPSPTQCHAVGAAADVPLGSMKHTAAAGHHLLVCNVGGALYALRDQCPGSMLPLAAGDLSGAELRCPWHGCRFDVRTGRCVDGRGTALETFPVTVVAGIIQVELPALSAPPAGVAR